MINVANMQSTNPALILAAFAANALAWLALTLIALIEWLVPALLGAGAVMVGLVAKHWRLLVTVAGLVAAVVAAALFWQAILLIAGVFGGMVAGLKLVMLHR